MRQLRQQRTLHEQHRCDLLACGITAGKQEFVFCFGECDVPLCLTIFSLYLMLSAEAAAETPFDREEMEQFYRDNGGESVLFDELEQQLLHMTEYQSQTRGSSMVSSSQETTATRGVSDEFTQFSATSGGDASRAASESPFAPAGDVFSAAEVPPALRRAPRSEAARRHGFDRSKATSWHLDPIDPELVGCANIDAAYARRMQLGRWRLPLEYLKGAEQPREVSAAELRKKGAMPTIRETNAFTQLFAPELIDDVKLLEERGLRDTFVCLCGLFGVEKARQVLRVIFDARQANMKLEPIPVSLALFTLDELVRSWAATGSRGDIFTINVDYRHYYYQFAIPKWLRQYVVVRFNGKLYHPTVLPMGYRDACLIAQVFTWCVVLHREAHEDALGVPSSLVLGAEMPRYIPLEGGGAIFVLLDGVFIMDPDEERHKLWKARLLRNEALFGIRRKVGFYLRFSDAGRCNCGTFEDPVPTEEQMKDAATFSGVEFLSRMALAPAKELPEVVVHPTWRQLSSRMGSILWHLRLFGAGRLLSDNPFSLLHHEGMLELWSRIGTNAMNGWQRQAVISEQEKQQLLRIETLLRGCTHNMQLVARPPCVECVRSARIFAVDATPFAMAFVQFQWKDDSLQYVGERASDFEGKIDQSEGELRAAVWAAISQWGASCCPFCKAPPLVLLGSDADGARAALRKGYSRSKVFRQRMRPLFTGGWLRLETVRVPGEVNAADAPSRGREASSDERCMRITQEILTTAIRGLLTEAYSFWRGRLPDGTPLLV